MALSLSLKPSRRPPAAAATPSRHPAAQANSRSAQFMPPRFIQAPPRGPKLTATRRSRFLSFIRKAVEESKGSAESEAEGAEGSSSESGGGSGELSEVGAEIKKAMMERKRKEEEEEGGGGGLLNGVAEEIGEIEWPAFGKVLGTTGVVLGVIAGSSVVLLTVNAVLAELSDRVFAGKGVQDFFS